MSAYTPDFIPNRTAGAQETHAVSKNCCNATVHVMKIEPVFVRFPPSGNVPVLFVDKYFVCNRATPYSAYLSSMFWEVA